MAASQTNSERTNRQPKTRLSHVLTFVAFASPVLFFWLYCVFIHPSHNYFTRDTEFQYFMNSLAIFKGGPYAYVDHPGTPVEIVGSGILGLAYLVLQKSPEAFISFLLRHPGLFMNLAHYFMILIHLACLYVFFAISFRSGGHGNAIPAAAFSALYFALHPLALGASVLWNHNAFSFPIGTLLLLGLFHHLTKDNSAGGLSIWVLVGLGLGAGVLAAITIYLAAWVVGMVVTIFLYYRIRGLPWVKTLGATALAGVSSVVGFYIAVLPVIDRMGAFWAWIFSILSHQSNYLAVPKDQSLIARMFSNLEDFYRLLPGLAIASMLLLALVAVALLLWRANIRKKPGLWALAAGLSCQVISLMLVFFDRPLRPYYFLSMAATLPMLALVVGRIYEDSLIASKILYWGLSLAAFVGLVVNTGQSIATKEREIANLAASEHLIPQIIRARADETGRSPEDLTILWMNGSYSTCWALWSGNHRAGNIFDAEIMQVCPNQFEFGQRILAPGGKIPLEEARWDIIFTCDKYLDVVLAKDPGAAVTHYASVEWNCGTMAVAVNQKTEP